MRRRHLGSTIHPIHVWPSSELGMWPTATCMRTLACIERVCDYAPCHCGWNVCVATHPVVVDELVHAAWTQRCAHAVDDGHAGVDVAQQLRLALARVGALFEQDNLRLLHERASVGAAGSYRS